MHHTSSSLNCYHYFLWPFLMCSATSAQCHLCTHLDLWLDYCRLPDCVFQSASLGVPCVCLSWPTVSSVSGCLQARMCDFRTRNSAYKSWGRKQPVKFKFLTNAPHAFEKSSQQRGKGITVGNLAKWKMHSCSGWKNARSANLIIHGPVHDIKAEVRLPSSPTVMTTIPAISIRLCMESLSEWKVTWFICVRYDTAVAWLPFFFTSLRNASLNISHNDFLA